MCVFFIKLKKERRKREYKKAINCVVLDIQFPAPKYFGQE